MEIADRILLTIEDLLVSIREAFTIENKDDNKNIDLDKDAAIAFISSLNSINIYANHDDNLSNLIAANVLSSNGSNITDFEDRLSLLLHLKSTLILRFPGDLLAELIGYFSAANTVGALVLNTPDATDNIRRYATTEGLKKAATEDPTIMLIWLMRITSPILIARTIA